MVSDDAPPDETGDNPVNECGNDAASSEPAAPPPDGDDGGADVTFDYITLGRHGKIQMLAHLPGSTYTDKFDVTDAEGREKFLNKFCARHPKVCREDVEDDLHRIAEEIMRSKAEGELSPESKDEAEGGSGGSDSESLAQIARKDNVDLFHVGARHDAEAYATIKFDNRAETWPVASSGFAHWLRHEFYVLFKRSPAAQAFTDAINLIVSIAVFEGAERKVHVRLAEMDGAIWLDLADDDWRAVRVTSTGWDVVRGNEIPVRFCRRRGMLPLPIPEREGSIDELRPFVNCPTDDLWTLYAGTLPAYLKPNGPYPVTVATGEQGSAKSSLVKKTRAVIDPNKSPARRLPREERDLMIAAKNSFMLVFDNLSSIPPSTSDALCSIATGGGFSARELYSDDEEKLFDAARPVILNGIEDIAARPDLLDRAVLLSLPPITEDSRKEDKDLDARFQIARPRILGALLDAASTALRRYDSIKLSRRPRMIDAVRWCTAAEESFGWAPETYLGAFMRNRGDANAIAIEASAVGAVVLSFMEGRSEWVGKPGELLVALEALANDQTRKRKDWPASPKGLSDAIRRLAPTLRSLGIDASIGARKAGGNRDRQIVLRRITPPAPPDGGTDTSEESGRWRDGSDRDNRPSENGPGNAPDGVRDAWDGRDGCVPTQSQDVLNSECQPSPEQRAAHDNSISSRVATQPSQASQPSRSGPGEVRKADSAGRLRDGSQPGGTVESDSDAGDWEDL